jgi:putative ABC transport system permease protein
MTPAEARRAAAIKFGPVEAIQDDIRDRASLPRIRALVQDLRYALRRWRRRPGFVLAAVLTLALGIGATTALFSVVDAVILRPLPYPDADRLVMVYSVLPERRHEMAFATTWDRGRLSWQMFEALRDLPAFDRIAVWRTMSMTLGEDRREIVPTLHVSASYLPTLGARVLHGRQFDDNATDEVMLSHGTWVRRFGARPEIVGERILLGVVSPEEQQPHTIVGVVEPGVLFPEAEPEFLISIRRPRPTPGHATSTPLLYMGVARIAAGASPRAAAEQAQAVIDGLASTEPTSIRLVGMVEAQLRDRAWTLWLLFGGAVLLLLIACSNVAGLLLGEGRLRRHEMAIRAAIGGSRGRLLQQLTIEHLLLALAGSVAGVVLAIGLTGVLMAIAPERLPRLEFAGVDPRVAAFGLTIGVLTFLLFGLLPALGISRARGADALAAPRDDVSRVRHLGHRSVVATQVGLALVLLVAASLFGETMLRLTSQPLGFNPEKLAVVTTSFTGNRWGPYADAAREAFSRPDFAPVVNRLQNQASSERTDRIVERLAALPGVLAAAGASTVPFSPLRGAMRITLEGQRVDEALDVTWQTVTSGYFAAMQMPVLDGRAFGANDRYGDRVAVVSRSFAHRFFGGDAVGRRFLSSDIHVEIVGVVPDVKHRRFPDEDTPAIYTLDRQGGSATHFIVRTSGDAAALLPSIRSAIAGVDPQLVVTQTMTMEQALAASIAEERFRARTSMLFGLAALVLAAVGLYGLAARRVAERRHEIGVRVAMGATPGDVRSLVLRDGLAIVSLGLLVGLPAAYAASQATQAFLFGVSPTAPHVFGLAAAVLGATALLATLLPAVRASRTDPSAVLRE